MQWGMAPAGAWCPGGLEMRRLLKINKKDLLAFAEGRGWAF